MIDDTSRALTDFTRRYCESWVSKCGHPPASSELYGVPSPCVQQTVGEEVWWLPQPFTLAKNLENIERALDLRLQPAVIAWYTSQFAGDMEVLIDGQPCTLLQVWSEEDFERVQENLIGHLVMKRRLKQPPTLFIATTQSEQEIVSVCNLTGNVILEKLGKKEHPVLAATLEEFLGSLSVIDPLR